jgi:division protein CdvB (Snf7/Vps24/ESCRT-III family)
MRNNCLVSVVQNAIRMKTQYINFLRLQSKIDAVASRLASAIRMNQVPAATSTFDLTSA